MFAVAHDSDSLALDFHNELYPEAKQLLDWENPFPGPDAAARVRAQPRSGRRVAAFLVSPLTVLSARRGGLGDRAPRARLLHALAADRRRPRLARVRRVRALAAGDRRDPRLAPDAVPLPARRARLALPRRARSPRASRVGLAGADQVLPLAARRLARRDRAGRARRSSPPPSPAASLLLVLPFTGLDDYFRTLLELGRTFDQDSYSPFGLPGADRRAGDARARRDARDRRRAPRRAAGAARASGSPSRPRSSCRRSCGSTTTRVAAIPLAVVRPRLSLVWLVAARDLGPAERGHRRRERLGQRPRADRVHDRLRGHRARRSEQREWRRRQPAATVRPRANRRLEPRSSPD